MPREHKEKRNVLDIKGVGGGGGGGGLGESGESILTDKTKQREIWIKKEKENIALSMREKGKSE